jgi:hypothetical protein
MIVRELCQSLSVILFLIRQQSSFAPFILFIVNLPSRIKVRYKNAVHFQAPLMPYLYGFYRAHSAYPDTFAVYDEAILSFYNTLYRFLGL